MKNQPASFVRFNPRYLQVFDPSPKASYAWFVLDKFKDRIPFPEEKYTLIPSTLRNAYTLINNRFKAGKCVLEWLEDPQTKTKTKTKNPINFRILNREPYPFQKEGIQYIQDQNGRCLIADEQGLGKTGESISWAHIAGLEKICVVCPASVKGVWTKEIKTWTGNENVYVASGRKPKSKQNLEKYQWIIINYDILPAWLSILGKCGFEAIIFDEAHYVKNTKPARSVAANELAKKIPHILLLSGTPFDKPIDIYSLIHMIDPLLFPSKMAFARRFCDLKMGYCSWDMTGAKNTKELHNILTKTVMIRRLKKDVLSDLPDKTRSVIPIELAKEQRREYEKAEVEFSNWLYGFSEDKRDKAKQAEAIVRVNTLKKAAAVAKLPSIFEWVDNYLENEKKLIIFAIHKTIIEPIYDRYRKISVKIDGGVSAKNRQEAVEGFQNDTGINLFIGNIFAAGTGLTLTAAKDTLTVELGWSVSAHDQAEDRPHRIGQKNAVGAYYMIAEGTIEEYIIPILDRKRSAASRILDGVVVSEKAMLTELLSAYGRK